MADKTKDVSTKLVRKKRIFYSLAAVLVILIASLLYFLLTGKQPASVIPVKELGKPTYLFSIYGDNKAGRLKDPLGVAVNKSSGVVYVADTRNRRIAAFDSKGKPLFQFSKIGKESLKSPSYVAVNPKGRNVYVSDQGFASIFIFDSKGKYIKKFIPNKNKKFPWVPMGMTFDKKGNLYVADKGLSRVVKFDKNGKRLLSIGEPGVVKDIKAKPGKMNFPNAVLVDSKGDIYVSDGNNQRVQVFDGKGKFKKIIQVKGLPRGIGVVEGGSSEGVYVVNVFDHQVQVFNKNGDALFTFGDIGQGEGEFRYPNDMIVDGNRLYIVDRANDRIQVWRF